MDTIATTDATSSDDEELRDEQDDPLFERALAYKTREVRAERDRWEWAAYVYRRGLGAVLPQRDLTEIEFYVADRDSDVSELVATIKSRLATRAIMPRILYRPDSDAGRLQRENRELKRQLTNTERELSITQRERDDLLAMIQTEDTQNDD